MRGGDIKKGGRGRQSRREGERKRQRKSEDHFLRVNVFWVYVHQIQARLSCKL